VNIRTAGDDDWPGIWPVFDAVVREGETYAFPLDLTRESAKPWWMSEPPGETVVLEQDGALLGTAKMGPNRPGRGAHIGTASFMVSPTARGRGVGRRLGEHVVAWHRERDFAGIQFNAVVETNTPAVRLWQDLGFEIIGTVPDAFDSPTHGRVGLHVMFLPLG
jgi:GNAT superfamily N-acetyltransferase